MSASVRVPVSALRPRDLIRTCLTRKRGFVLESVHKRGQGAAAVMLAGKRVLIAAEVWVYREGRA